jgi:hypothetical protein
MALSASGRRRIYIVTSDVPQLIEAVLADIERGEA